MKLGTKAVILITALVVFVCGISSAIMLFFHEQALRDSVHAGVNGIARANALNISSFVHDSKQIAQIIATNVPVEALQSGRIAEVETYLERMSRPNRFANGVFLLDRSGRFLTDYPAHPELRGQSFAFRDYFQRTVAEKRGVVGEPYFSRRTGAPVLTFTAPILDSRKNIRAIVACSVDLLAPHALGEVCAQRIGTTGYVYVFDKSRLMILHPDRTRLLKRDIPKGANHLLDEAIKGFEGVGETVNSRGVEMLLGYRQIPETSWIVGVQMPKEEAFASLYESRRLMVFTALMTTLLLLVVGFWAMLTISLPLRHLHSAATTIMEELEGNDRAQGSGNILALLDNMRTRDEIGDLARAFRKLVVRQRESVSILRKAAFRDALTGLPNRALAIDRLEQSIISCLRNNRRCAVLFLDLDQFKPVNDTFGHDCGDELLRQVAGRLQEVLRREDTVGRIGGDEFLVVVPEVMLNDDAIVVAEKIIKSLADPFEIGEKVVRIGCSIGISICPEDGICALHLIANADAAMYEVKRNGRGDFRIFSGLPPSNSTQGAGI